MGKIDSGERKEWIYFELLKKKPFSVVDHGLALVLSEVITRPSKYGEFDESIIFVSEISVFSRLPQTIHFSAQ